jgi:hypothetical protein
LPRRNATPETIKFEIALLIVPTLEGIYYEFLWLYGSYGIEHGAPRGIPEQTKNRIYCSLSMYRQRQQQLYWWHTHRVVLVSRPSAIQVVESEYSVNGLEIFFDFKAPFARVVVKMTPRVVRAATPKHY